MFPDCKKYDQITQFATQKKVQKRTMTLLHIMSPTSPPKVPHNHTVGVVKQFFKRSRIPIGELVINLRANIFGASDESDAFKENQLKNITRSVFHFLAHILQRSAARVQKTFYLHGKTVHRSVGLENSYVLPHIFPPNTLVDYATWASSVIVVHLILVYSEQRVV